jgi:hypothetical protein
MNEPASEIQSHAYPEAVHGRGAVLLKKRRARDRYAALSESDRIALSFYQINNHEPVGSACDPCCAHDPETIATRIKKTTDTAYLIWPLVFVC